MAFESGKLIRAKFTPNCTRLRCGLCRLEYVHIQKVTVRNSSCVFTGVCLSTGEREWWGVHGKGHQWKGASMHPVRWVGGWLGLQKDAGSPVITQL